MDYIWDSKKQLKIEEIELLDMLNDDLRNKLTVCLNARILEIIHVLSNFEMEFLSDLTFIITKENFANDEDIVVEGDRGEKLFFILQGKAAIIHKRTHTFIQNLQQDSYFGEVAFFSGLVRQTTVKSREFTELFVITTDNFLELARLYDKAFDMYTQIQELMDLH